MTAEEMINSDDIEIAKLGVKILRQQKGKSYTANLIRKYDKYEFRKGIGLITKPNWHKIQMIREMRKVEQELMFGELKLKK
jgi:hypothetical protein